MSEGIYQVIPFKRFFRSIVRRTRKIW